MRRRKLALWNERGGHVFLVGILGRSTKQGTPEVSVFFSVNQFKYHHKSRKPLYIAQVISRVSAIGGKLNDDQCDGAGMCPTAC